jgi:hypothetical protein
MLLMATQLIHRLQNHIDRMSHRRRQLQSLNLLLHLAIELLIDLRRMKTIPPKRRQMSRLFRRRRKYYL